MVSYERVAVDTSFASSSSNGYEDPLAASAAPPVSSPIITHRRAFFSMEQQGGAGDGRGGGGGEEQRRRRRRQGRGGLESQSPPVREEEDKNRRMLSMLGVHHDDESYDCEASSDGGSSSSSSSSSREEMFEQEFEATSDHHHHRRRRRRAAAEWTSNNNNSNNNNNKSNNNITVRQAFVHLLKGYVGPGCLSLPWAMSQLGISVGAVMIFVVCLWSSYNCRVVLLLKRQRQRQQQSHLQQNQNTCIHDDRPSHHHHHHHHTSNNHITYPQLAEWLYPTSTGRRGRSLNMCRLTTVCICIQQLAVCTVFLSFVGTNLQAVYMAVWNVQLSHQVVIALALPAVLALSCLPNLKALAPVTFLATLLLMLGFALIGVVIAKVAWWNNNNQNEHAQHYFSQPKDSDSTTHTGPNYKQWPTAICAILYSFEGICLVLPVEQAMTSQQAKRHFMPTFALAMLTSATIFATLSYFCVATFGPITNGSITAFLLQKYGHFDNTTPNDATNDHDALTHNGRRFLQDAQEQQQQQQPYLMDWLLAANAVVSLSVLITYPLQIFPALELAEPILNPAKSTSAQLDTDRLELIPQHDDNGDHNGDHTDNRRDDDDDNLNNHASPKQGTTLVGYNKHKEKKNRHWNDDDDRFPFQVVAHHQQPSSQRAARGEASNAHSISNGLAAAKGQGNGSDTRITTTASMKTPTATDESTTVATSSHDNDEKERENVDNNVASVKTRIILVLFTFVVAVAVPNVQVLISLAGALAGSTVALLIPPALEIAWLFKCQEAATTTTTTTPPSKFTRDLIRCYLLFALGFLFLCIGTGASLLDIYETNHGQGSSSATISPNGDDTGP